MGWGRRDQDARGGDGEESLGQEHFRPLTSMANLAPGYRNQGRWTEVEKLQV